MKKNLSVGRVWFSAGMACVMLDMMDFVGMGSYEVRMAVDGALSGCEVVGCQESLDRFEAKLIEIGYYG